MLYINNAYLKEFNAKIINITVPLKVKTYIDESLAKEIKHFKARYKLEFNIISDNKLVIPEYKIDLLNKNNKIIKKIEHIEEVEKILSKVNYDRKNFKNTKFNKNFKMRNKFKKKFKHHSKIKKNNFENKKLANF